MRKNLNLNLQLSPETFKSADFKMLLKPLAFLLLVAGLMVAILYFGLRELKSMQSKINTASQTEANLIKKVQILTKVTEVIPEEISFINLALPDQNAVIYALAQIRTMASSNALLVTNLRSGGSFETKGVSKVTLSFEVSGDESGIYSFLDQVTKALPIMSVDKAKISAEAGTLKASVSLNVFSSELPKKIPSLTSPVAELNASEVELLNLLATYSQPSFFEVTASEESLREDPFN